MIEVTVELTQLAVRAAATLYRKVVVESYHVASLGSVDHILHTTFF